MSLRGLPIQFLNLGGEMMYIIDQRLMSQDIPSEKAEKVRNDILSVMLSESFVEELFHPQALYSRSALRTVFEKLAHASIMKMNYSSMNKLFDLMLMSLKHQLVLTPIPRDLFWVTLNHLDAMMGFTSSADVQEQINLTRHIFLNIYMKLDLSDWLDLRRDLLSFVQDIKIRVSIFLKTGIQDHLARLVLPTSGQVATGSEVPGTVRVFDPQRKTSLVTLFPSGGSYTSASDSTYWIQFGANRGVKLGMNLYSEEQRDHCYPTMERQFDAEQGTTATTLHTDDYLDESSALKSQEELNLLAFLIGTPAQSSQKKEFKLNIVFNEDENKGECLESSPDLKFYVIKIEGGSRTDDPHIGKILDQLQIGETNSASDKNGSEEDLLQLLDST